MCVGVCVCLCMAACVCVRVCVSVLGGAIMNNNDSLISMQFACVTGCRDGSRAYMKVHITYAIM